MGMFDSFYDAKGREWQTKAFGNQLAAWRVGDPISSAPIDHQVAVYGTDTARCTCGEKFRGETRTAALIALVDHIDSASLVGSSPEGQKDA